MAELAKTFLLAKAERKMDLLQFVIFSIADSDFAIDIRNIQSIN